MPVTQKEKEALKGTTTWLRRHLSPSRSALRLLPPPIHLSHRLFRLSQPPVRFRQLLAASQPISVPDIA
eukprot:670502-Rhodomonas_salina.2